MLDIIFSSYGIDCIDYFISLDEEGDNWSTIKYEYDKDYYNQHLQLNPARIFYNYSINDIFVTC